MKEITIQSGKHPGGGRLEMETSILLPGIEVRELRSTILNQDLLLFVKLPWRYDQSDTSYPVLFSLDGNRSFLIFSTTSLMFETPGTNVQEIIIVGVGYKVDSDRIKGLAQWGAWRTRDFTPVRRLDIDRYWIERLTALLGGENIEVQSGGAARFLKSLREEIIPFIETNYRVSSSNRGLAGHSYGGLFTLYALFHTPETFRHYFAGSPAIWEKMIDYEEEYASSHENLPAKLLITVGEKEADFLERTERMVRCLRSRAYPGLVIRTQVLKGMGHVEACASFIIQAISVTYDEGSWD
jgi:predicted alpha/beta superfamily hydrolase